MGRGPVRPIKFSDHGPRHSPAHHFFRGWAAAQCSPSHFQSCTAWPAPAHDIGRGLGSVRHFRGPARAFDGPEHGPAHVLSRTINIKCTHKGRRGVFPQFFFSIFPKCRYFPIIGKNREIPKFRENTGKNEKAVLVKITLRAAVLFLLYFVFVFRLVSRAGFLGPAVSGP